MLGQTALSVYIVPPQRVWATEPVRKRQKNGELVTPTARAQPKRSG